MTIRLLVAAALVTLAQSAVASDAGKLKKLSTLCSHGALREKNNPSATSGWLPVTSFGCARGALPGRRRPNGSLAHTHARRVARRAHGIATPAKRRVALSRAAVRDPPMRRSRPERRRQRLGDRRTSITLARVDGARKDLLEIIPTASGATS
jgi:hypothetical protein